MKSAKLAKRIAADSRRTVLRELQTQDAAPFSGALNLQSSRSL